MKKEVILPKKPAIVKARRPREVAKEKKKQVDKLQPHAILCHTYCRRCMKDLVRLNATAPAQSIRDYSEIECGWTEHGFQVWCTRHNRNVLHIDLHFNKATILTDEKEP
jgi:hypothetical protein